MSVACCESQSSGRGPTAHTGLDANNNRDHHSGKLGTVTPPENRQSDCRLGMPSYVSISREEPHNGSYSEDHMGCDPSC